MGSEELGSPHEASGRCVQDPPGDGQLQLGDAGSRSPDGSAWPAGSPGHRLASRLPEQELLSSSTGGFSLRILKALPGVRAVPWD